MDIFPHLTKQAVRDRLMDAATDDIINVESTESAIRLMDDVFNGDTNVSITKMDNGMVALTWFHENGITDYIICGSGVFDCFHIHGDGSIIISDAELGNAERFIFDHITR